MSTFVLGLLVSASKATYDQSNTEITQISAQVILLDRLLANYGPNAQQARDLLRNYLTQQFNQIWANEKGISPAGPPPTRGEDLYLMVETLLPGDERQKALRAEALATIMGTGRIRWLFWVHRANSVPTALVAIMISWLTVVFMSFGAFAPRNWTAVGSVLIAALCVSAAIFLIQELYAPLSGLIRIPATSVRSALAQLGK